MQKEMMVYIENRLKDLGMMLAGYEDHRDAMQKDEDTSYYDRLVLVGRARISELKRFQDYFNKENVSGGNPK